VPVERHGFQRAGVRQAVARDLQVNPSCLQRPSFQHRRLDVFFPTPARPPSTLLVLWSGQRNRDEPWGAHRGHHAQAVGEGGHLRALRVVVVQHTGIHDRLADHLPARAIRAGDLCSSEDYLAVIVANQSGGANRGFEGEL